MKLRDIDYKTEFYWRGERYRQFISHKDPSRIYYIFCYKAKDLNFKPVAMSAAKEVKPVLKPSDIKR